MSIDHTNQHYDHLFKVIVAGSSGVGKTSILNRYVDGIFPEGHYTTIGVDFKIKTLAVYVNGVPKNVKLQIWDTAGAERFQAITSGYFRGSHGIILVFGLNDLASFNRIESWMETATIEHRIPFRILVGNKADLVGDDRKVSEDMVLARYPPSDVTYIEVSAKTGQAINEMFSAIATKLTETALMENDKDEEEDLVFLTDERVNPLEKRTGNRCCGGTG